jgi:formate/nitrite transporter FocA (FNT family)
MISPMGLRGSRSADLPEDPARKGKTNSGEDAPLSDELEDREQDIDLSDEEREAVAERAAASPRVIHEVVRRRGDEELERPAGSLIWSGLAGGVAISTSVLGQALLESRLPDAPWAPLIASIGYTLGFVIVVLGNLQLFGRLLRLWSLVFLSNIVGTLFIAGLTNYGLVGSPEQREAMLALSRKLLTHDWLETVKLAIPAGFLVAAVPWTLPSSRGQQFLVVVFLTYFIALGGFAHVVAGSAEAWLLAFAGETTFAHSLFGLICPALIGNIVGGTGLFALLAHAQVQQEL